jgi:O-antigen/teichoic acid export membrane protein
MSDQEAPVDSAGRSVAHMARGSGLNLVGAVCNQSALFLIMTALALRLGGRDVGRYAECFALLSLLGLLSLAGFRSALTRFVAFHLADDDPGRLRGTVRLGLGSSVVGAMAIGMVLALLSTEVAELFNDPGLSSSIVLVALALPASTFEVAALSATQGWRSQKAYTLIGSIFDPCSRLLLTVVLVLAGAGLQGAMWALVASSWAGAALAAVALRRRMRSVPRASPVYEFRDIFGFSMMSWGSALATTGLIWADVLILGHLSTQENVGVYTVATRLVMLAVFVMAPINAALFPHLSHLYRIGDLTGVARAYGAANRWIMRLSMPAFILLLAFPRDLLSFFGHGFAAGADVTVILAIGQMVSAAAGPCGIVLNMSGRVALSMIDNVAVLAVNVALNLWLIPSHGILGAAVAWSLSLTLVNLAKLLQVRHVLGVRSADAGWLKTYVAAVPAVACAVLVAWMTSGWISAVVLGGGVVTLSFFTAIALLGVGQDDAAMVRSVTRRLGLPVRLVREV